MRCNPQCCKSSRAATSTMGAARLNVSPPSVNQDNRCSWQSSVSAPAVQSRSHVFALRNVPEERGPSCGRLKHTQRTTRDGLAQIMGRSRPSRPLREHGVRLDGLVNASFLAREVSIIYVSGEFSNVTFGCFSKYVVMWHPL